MKNILDLLLTVGQIKDSDRGTITMHIAKPRKATPGRFYFDTTTKRISNG